jgi:glycine cleavage system aminomethyltransferase T/glycine/D-amino acid oxidase-like deaminating enzyme
VDPVVTLPRSADVVVIGGGIIGASILYHLANRGVERAVLLERKRLASGTTWHAAGIVGQLRESSSQTALAKYTTRLFQELETETGQATGYKQNGTINLALSDVRLEQLLRSNDHAKRVGVDARMLSMDALAEHWPLVSREGVKGAFFVPSNGQVNPLDVTHALAKGARQKNASVIENCLVTKLVVRDGKVVGVETDQGDIETAVVVLAGGMWTHHFAKQHGVTVPLQAAEHFYIVTEPVEGLARNLPGLVVAEERIYAKEDAGKLLIGGFEHRGKPWAVDGIPHGFEFDELPFDMAQNEPLLHVMFERIPQLADMGIKTFFCGPESFTPDGRPYLGPAPELKGLFIAAGMNSNGILNAGGVGLTIAEWILEGIPRKGMTSLLAARAHPFQANRRYLEERTKEAIGLHYGLLWPGRQIETARGVRRVPLHAQFKAAGAVFAERIGWEVPMYFDADHHVWPTRASLGFQDWSPLVKQECLAVRDGVVLHDQSMYGKIMVQGPDAVRALNRVCGAEMDVLVGTSVYTPFLNQRGGIEADVTVTRLAAQSYLVVTGHPSQIRDQAWIKQHADTEWHFEVFDATSAYALLGVHGPLSRAVLQACSNDDLSNEALPFGAAREIDIGFARAWIIRRSFFGSLGFELLVSAEFSAGVYEALVEAGKPHGLRHAGMFAMNHCRMEKAFRHFGHDLGEEDTPFETGLGFAVALEKSEDFLGRKVLAAQKAEGTLKHRTVAVKIVDASESEGPFLIHNEPIFLGDKIVGHVTSGAWGYRVNASLGLATVHHGDGVTAAWLRDNSFDVTVAGKRYTAVLQLKPFYDPERQLMKS